MDTITEVLKDISSRIGRKVTQTELSQACGVTQGHMSNVVLGKQKGSLDIYQKIANYLSKIDDGNTYSAEFLMGSAPLSRTTSGYNVGLVKPAVLGSEFVTLPEVGAIPCGRFEDITSDEVRAWHLVPQSLAGKAKIIVKAVGDSMAPGIQPDDLLLVEEVQASDIMSEDVIIADIEGELGCKRVAKYGENIVLNSDNPAHRPIHINGGQTITVVGRVVGLHRKF